MALVPGSNSYEIKDYSKEGCRTRRVDCRGAAEAEDKRRTTALKEAKAEAKRQRDLAIAEAKRTIGCPTDGCERGTCRQVGKWYTGNTLGYSAYSKRIKLADGSKGWRAIAKYHREIRLKCRCRR